MQKLKKISIAIVAHIDHGKSTLCDAIIEFCSGKKLSSSSPSLDSHEVEKARGVTIRNHFIRLKYKNTIIYLVDTPGHYDFAQYVKIGINCCDSVVLLTDITKGIQAQTMSHIKTCKKNEKKIFPIINKIDLGIRDKIAEIKSILSENLGDLRVFEVSAKTRENIRNVFEYIIENTEEEEPRLDKLRFMVLDCVHNTYIGKILFIKVISGLIRKGDKIEIFGKLHKVDKIEFKEHISIEVNEVSSGDFCYLYANISFIHHSSLVGTTFVTGEKETRDELKPLIFGNIIPKSPEEHESLKKAIEKTLLGDQSITVEHQYSRIYGNIFRCGFFGDFHKSIFYDKIKIENKINFRTSSAEPLFKIKNEDKLNIHLDTQKIKANFKEYLSGLETPFTRVILNYNGIYHNKLISCITRNLTNYTIIDAKFYVDNFYMVISVLSADVWEKFIDMVKSCTNGYIDISIDNIEYKKTELGICEFSINRDVIEEFTFVDTIERIRKTGDKKLEMLKNTLERQQFEIIINMAINKRIVGKETIKPYRKDVTAKLYGGDSTRRKKLLKKQNEGKKSLLKGANIGELKAHIISTMRNSKD